MQAQEPQGGQEQIIFFGPATKIFMLIHNSKMVLKAFFDLIVKEIIFNMDLYKYFRQRLIYEYFSWYIQTVYHSII